MSEPTLPEPGPDLLDSKHLSKEQIRAYQSGTLPPTDLLRVDGHLTSCARCRARLAEAEAAAPSGHPVRLTLPEEPSEHLEYEQIEGYIDGTLDAADREIAEGHLLSCAACTKETTDLRAFRALLSTYPAKQYAPAKPPTLPAPAKPPTLRERWAALWPTGFRGVPLPALGSAAAALLIAFWVGVHPLQSELVQTKRAAQNQQRDQQRDQQRNLDRLRSQLQQSENQLQKTQKQAEQKTDDLSRQARAGLAAAQAMKSHIDALQTQKAGLEAQARDLQAKLAQKSGTVPVPAQKAVTPPAPLVAYRDARATVVVDSAGHIQRIETIPLAPAVSDEGRGIRGQSGASLDGARLLRPVGTTVDSVQPRFDWQAAKHAATYRVRVTDAAGRVLASSPALSHPQWTPLSPLPRGQALTWQVTVREAAGPLFLLPSPPAPPAPFRVLDLPQTVALTAARQRYHGNALALGVLYAEYGLWPEAEQQLAQYVRAHPKAEGPRKLLRNLRGQQSS